MFANGLTLAMGSASTRATASLRRYTQRRLAFAFVLAALALGVLLPSQALAATAVSNVSVSAAPATAKSTRVVDEVGFKATTALASYPTGFIRLEGPAGSSFADNGGDYVVRDGANTAYAYVTVNPEGEGQNIVDVYVPESVSVEAGDTVHVTVFGVANPTTASPSAEFGVSTTSDTTVVKKTLAITAAAAVTNLSAGASTFAAGATGVVDTVSFKASGPLSNGKSLSCCGDRGFVMLTAPAGTEFHSYQLYTVTDGSESGTSSGEVDPEGLGDNVVRIPLPYELAVAAGDTVHVTARAVSNPSSAVPSGEFAVSTSSDATAVKKPFAITVASAVSSVSVSSFSPTAGARRNVDEVSFTATSAMPWESECDYYYYGYYFGCGHFVELTAPAGTEFASSADDYLFTDGATSGFAYYYAEVDPEGTGNNVVRVYLPYEMSVAAGDTVHLTVFGVTSPASAAPAGELAVSTAADAKPVTTPFAIGASTAVSGVSVGASSYAAGATGVVDTASFKASHAITSGEVDGNCCGEPGYVRLTAPAGTEFEPYYYENYTVTDGAASESASVEVDPEGLGRNVVDVFLPRGVPVAAGDTVHVTARAVSNPSSAVPSGEFAVSTSSDATAVKKPFAITVASAVSSVSVSSFSPTAGARRNVDEVSFTATSAMPWESECDYYYYGYYFGCGHFVELTAPAGTEFASSADDYLFTDGATSGFAYYYAEVDPEGTGNNVVRVYLPYEMSVAAGDTVHLTVFGVTSPASAAPAGELAVSTAADAKPVTTPFAIGASTAVSGVSVGASSYAAGATGVVDTASFKASHAITSGEVDGNCCGEPGYVRLTAPAGTEFEPSYEIYTVTAGAAAAEASVEVDPEGLGQNVVDVFIPRGVPVTAGDTVQVVAYGVSNPPSAMPSGEFAVSTSSDATPVKKPFAITGTAPPVDVHPPTIQGTAERGQTLVESHGTWSNGPTGYAYQWLACEGSSCTAIAGATSRVYVVGAGDVGKTLEVQEVADNRAGSGSPAVSSATATVVEAPLQAVAGEEIEATQGAPVSLNGSGSTPAEAITSYEWNFGDTNTGSGAIVDHTYTSPGSYTATLTVGDGQSSASSSVKVNVSAASGPHAEARIVDGASQPIEGAEVLYIAPQGQRTEAISSADGVAPLSGLPDGNDTVYVYKEGFRPAVGHIAVSGGTGQQTITLASGAVATSTLKNKEMTLKEIEEAGINPNDPANQNVYDFEIRLAFFPSPLTLKCHVNSAGEFVGGCGFEGAEGEGGGEGGGGGGGGEGGEGGEGVEGVGEGYCSPHACQINYAGGSVGVVPKIVEGHPLIEWLILQGKATVLKQFTTVTLAVQDLAPEPFKLTNGSATLTLPQGLSLAPTASPQALSQPVANIPGESSASETWVVRGDTPGSYYMSAEYKAQLQPFAAPVDITAALANPFRVWGKEAFKLSVKADEGKLETGRPYHVTVAITNEAPIPFYNMNLSIDSNVHANFDFQPDERFNDEIGELPAGATLYSHKYVLLPDAPSYGVFNPALSSIAFDGEEAKPGENIEEVTPPPLYGTVEALSDTPARIHLHWQPVPGAEGYEVFSTPSLHTAFAEAPDPASSTADGALSTSPLPADATEGYLAGTDGLSRFYAVSALIEGHPTVESQAVQASTPASSPLTVTTASLPDGEVDGGYAATLTAKEGTTPYTWSLTAGSLPAGLHLDPDTGTIVGTPSTAGTSDFTVKVTDASSQTATADLSITVTAAAAQAAQYGQCVAQKKGEYANASCTTKSAKAHKGIYEWKSGPAPKCVAQKKGEYTNATCTTKSAKAHKGEYEKKPGPGYTSTTGSITLETSGLDASKVVCAASTAVGEVTGAKTGVERMTITGCEQSGKACASEGPNSTPSGKSGVVVTDLLDTRLIGPVAGEVWTQLLSGEHEPYVFEINCGGTQFRTIGSLAGVQAGDLNVSSLTSTTTFATLKGEQALYSELSSDGGTSWAGPDSSTWTMAATNTAASETEIKT